MYEVIERLAENNERFRQNKFQDRHDFEQAQIVLLEQIPLDDPIWFELHVGVRGLWKFPHLFVVDADLFGRAKQADPKTPMLFRRIIEEFTDGSLSLDHFSLALQKLSRRSTREQFDWYRSVLEQKIQFPTSPKLFNRLGREFRLHEPSIPRIDHPARVVVPLKSVIIEECNIGDRVFADSIHKVAYDEHLEPNVAFWNWFAHAARNSPVMDKTCVIHFRFEFYQGMTEVLLRDFEVLDNWKKDPRYQLPHRIDSLMEVWDYMDDPNCNMIERVHVEPERLQAEIDLIRQKGFSGFNLIQGNGDALSFQFNKNPVIEIDSTQIRIHVSQT